MFLLLVLFLALGGVLALLTWAELAPSRRAPKAPATAGPEPATEPTTEPAPPGDDAAAGGATRSADAAQTQPGDADDAVLARIAAELTPAEMTPEPAETPAETEDAEFDPALSDEALTHVRGFAPGDLLELELDRPAPAPEEIRFEQAGPHTRVLIAQTPVLLIEDSCAADLTPAIFRFRSSD